MERMNNGAAYDSLFWKLLEKEKLGDLSQFHRPHFIEEVPLYARFSDISFLKDHSTLEGNKVLLAFSLKYLRSVIAFETHRAPYFAAITIWGGSASEPLVPNLFVWSGSTSKLADMLSLTPARTPFGQWIKRMVSRLGLQEPHQVFEDTSTCPELPRVFIGPSKRPYPSFVTLSKLRSRAGSVK
jgi:hypothetical protein